MDSFIRFYTNMNISGIKLLHLLLCDHFVLANSADPDEMPYNVAFHLATESKQLELPVKLQGVKIQT